MRYLRASITTACLLISAAPHLLAQSPNISQNLEFVNFESPHVHPMDLNVSRTQLAVCNTAAGRVEIFNVSADKGKLTHIKSLFSGLDPVSVRYRTDEELWIANHVSDTVTIFDPNNGALQHLVETPDEPCDIVFAGSPSKAYITCSAVNSVLIIDANNPTSEDRQEFIVEGEDPRSLIVSPDGRFVLAAVYESGNASTILGGGRTESPMLNYPPNVVSSEASPYKGTNPPPNYGETFKPERSKVFPPKWHETSLIVKRNTNGKWMDDNEGDWTRLVSGDLATESGRQPGWDVVDNDIAVIDTNTGEIAYIEGLMTTCMTMAANPATGAITLVGTEAHNEIRFEPNLNGKFIEVRQASFSLDGNGDATSSLKSDLNPHLDYSKSTVPQGVRDLSIGDPRAIAWNETGDLAYIAGMGSNNVVVINSTGDRASASPIEVGEGPTGLALHDEAERLYVLNRFEGSVSVINTTTREEVSRHAYPDPTPDFVRKGRRHLYSTHETSGLGQASCASCHVDARMDRLAWDLGRPQESTSLKKDRTVDVLSDEGARFEQQLVKMSFMKGPMVTTTLQGIIGNGPFHWRGDKDDLEEFNDTYTKLLGDDEDLTDEEMVEFKRYLATLYFPPNPHREMDGSLAENLPLPGELATGDFELKEGAPLPPGNARRGEVAFTTRSFPQREDVGFLAGRSCAQCHSSSLSGGYYQGRRSLVTEMAETTMEVGRPPSMRGLAEKLGFRSQSKSLTGFGLLHDGSMDTLSRYLTQPLFDLQSDQEVADLIAYMISITGDTFNPARAGFGGSTTTPAAQNMFRANAYDVHPGVGFQFDLETVRQSPVVILQAFSLLGIVENSRGALEAVLHATTPDGNQRSMVYDADKEHFLPDSVADESQSLVAILRRSDLLKPFLTFTPHNSQATYGRDVDGDELLDFDEFRDLQPNVAGVQNPFDPLVADALGNVGQLGSDGTSDGSNDFDGDGLSNHEEFQLGLNPIAEGRLPGGAPAFEVVLASDSGLAHNEIVFYAKAHRAYRVEYSRDLKTWTELTRHSTRVNYSGLQRLPLPDFSPRLIDGELTSAVYYRVRQIE